MWSAIKILAFIFCSWFYKSFNFLPKSLLYVLQDRIYLNLGVVGIFAIFALDFSLDYAPLWYWVKIERRLDTQSRVVKRNPEHSSKVWARSKPSFNCSISNVVESLTQKLEQLKPWNFEHLKFTSTFSLAQIIKKICDGHCTNFGFWEWPRYK